MFGDRLAIAGLGGLQIESEEYLSGRSVWQWCQLPFGQHILAKREAGVTPGMTPDQFAEPKHGAAIVRTDTRSVVRVNPIETRSLFDNNHVANDMVGTSGRPDGVIRVRSGTLDAWTNEVISSNFDDQVLGQMLNECIDTSQSVEKAIGFSAIIAKAKLARLKRRR